MFKTVMLFNLIEKFRAKWLIDSTNAGQSNHGFNCNNAYRKTQYLALPLPQRLSFWDVNRYPWVAGYRSPNEFHYEASITFLRTAVTINDIH